MSAAPGWYPVNEGRELRYWDGRGWTGDVQVVEERPDLFGAYPAWQWVVAGLFVAVPAIGLVAALAWLITL